MGCCNCREIEIENMRHTTVIDTSRAQNLRLKKSAISQVGEDGALRATFIEKQSTNLYSEAGARISQLDNTMNKSGNLVDTKIDSSHTLEFHNHLPKSFLETVPSDHVFNERVLINNDFSASFKHNNPVNLKYRNQNQINYMTQLKDQAKQNLVIEEGSKAEESGNLTTTLKELPNYNLTQTTTVFNSIENGSCRENKIECNKVLVKHALKKNKSPKFLNPIKKQLTLHPRQLSSDQDVANKHSFIANKDTLTKYKYLFSDIENSHAETLRIMKRQHTKKLSNLEDSDFTNLQKFGTIYSTNKTNSSQILTEEAKKTFTCGTKRAGNISQMYGLNESISNFHYYLK